MWSQVPTKTKQWINYSPLEVTMTECILPGLEW